MIYISIFADFEVIIGDRPTGLYLACNYSFNVCHVVSVKTVSRLW